MFFDFFEQFLYAVIFFLGIAGVGLMFLKLLRFRGDSLFLNFSISYFISLCFYTVISVYFLFFVENKRLFLALFTLSYFWASFVFIFFFYLRKRKWSDIKNYFKSNRVVFFAAVVVVFVFFLQIYNTSILDEWLHRPIVKFFAENGEFPLKNPFNPDESFIYNYHYGTQIDSAAIQIIFRNGISQSLDIFKLSYFIGAFFLFYGIISTWTKNKKYSILFSVFLIFCGGSFFFLDGFSTGSLWKVDWLDQHWTFNSPLALILTGITYVNIPMLLAFLFLAENLFKNKKFYSFVSVILMSFSVVGFFIISEFFSVIFLVSVIFLTVVGFLKKDIIFSKIVPFWIFAIFIILTGVYFSGGVMGNVINSKLKKVMEKGDTAKNVVPKAVFDKNMTEYPNQKWITPRKVSEWGYPSEKRIIFFKENAFFYLRNFFLEILLFGVVIFYRIKKKINFKENYLFSSLAVFCLLAPFIFSSSTGDLNFSKLINVGLVFFRLVCFYFLIKLNSKKLSAVFIILFIIGSIPGILFSGNIQWKFVSSKKGKSVYCSQNPLCYKERITDFLEKFEKENPGLKFVMNDGDAAQKLVDLTNSYSVVAEKGELSYDYLREKRINYIFNDLESEDKFDLLNLEKDDKITRIMFDGRYEMFQVK